MKAIEQLERLKRINEHIKAESTGTPEEFSGRLGIGRRQFFRDLECLKDMGVEISYSKIRGTYFYKNGYKMEISYTFKIIPKMVAKKINGGFFLTNYQSAFFMHSANLV
jgi:predicted DNA-binding transcriptional regulator YafY